jgi:hypothetical protein
MALLSAPDVVQLSQVISQAPAPAFVLDASARNCSHRFATPEVVPTIREAR